MHPDSASKRFIKVILPLKLRWEPFYSVDSDLNVAVGDRVKLSFAGRPYLGVVSAIDVWPESGLKLSSIKGIYCKDDSQPGVLPTEIAFWRLMADYYLCSVGEVYKAAYPVLRNTSTKRENPAENVTGKEMDENKPDICLTDLPKEGVSILGKLREISALGKPVLMRSTAFEEPLAHFCADVAADASAGNILWLVPEIKFSKAVAERFKKMFGKRFVLCTSSLTPARRRRLLSRIRDGKPYVVLGTRSALFLPHRDLGLVVVQDEQDCSYKQSSPSPRYNGRDAAVLLATLFKARTVLTSECPSLESLVNCMTGKYVSLSEQTPRWPEVEIIDMLEERRKNGIEGLFAKRLHGIFNSDNVAVFKPKRASFPKIDELVAQADSFFGKRVAITDDLVGNPLHTSVNSLIIMGIDSLLGRDDFRADEKTVQIVRQAVAMCGLSLERVYIQTRESGHPIFAALKEGNLDGLLDERRRFGYPPFTRIVDILVMDNIVERGQRMATKLQEQVENIAGCSILPFPMSGSSASSVRAVSASSVRAVSASSVRAMPMVGIRVALTRDRCIKERKNSLRTLVEEFERIEKYSSHIIFDVDPF